MIAQEHLHQAGECYDAEAYAAGDSQQEVAVDVFPEFANPAAE